MNPPYRACVCGRRAECRKQKPAGQKDTHTLSSLPETTVKHKLKNCQILPHFVRRECQVPQRAFCLAVWYNLRQHRTIPALRLKHRSGSCGTASALPKCSIMSGCGTRIVLRGAKAPRTLRPLPLLRFAVSATGGAHLCSIQYYLRFWLGICRTSLAVSALRIMRYCPKKASVGNSLDRSETLSRIPLTKFTASAHPRDDASIVPYKCL